MEMKTDMEACTSHISQDMSGALYDVIFSSHYLFTGDPVLPTQEKEHDEKGVIDRIWYVLGGCVVRLYIGGRSVAF